MIDTTASAGYALDESDLRILAALQQDASLDNQQLARRVHLSPAPCLRRVRRLTQDGVIRATVALLDAGRLGLGVEAFAFVALESQRATAGAQFEALLRRRPEVIECVRLSGSYDYLLRVVVASLDAYSAFIDRHLLPIPGVRSVNSSFSLGVLKRTTALPLPEARRSPHARRAARAVPSAG
ncbi:MAG TPA: Lrp/AsnC family transcriptional regulator [Steroidobacteraceae bacterium]|nr:Lrp/AsnC family transcriptional regulator [Steroidobacteraceae bacterium]